MADHVVFLVGASGAGKTTVAECLRDDPTFEGVCYFFDSVGVPTAEEFAAMEDEGRSWQVETTHAWIERLAGTPGKLAILEGQTTPACVEEKARGTLASWQTILLDCTPGVRLERLTARGRPKLANHQMDCWAAYLAGQADALHLPKIDTSEMTVEEVALEVRRLVGGPT